MKILYKYSISLDLIRGEAEYELREHKINIVQETEKTIQFFDGRSRKLKKEKLNQIDTIFDENSFKFMSYYIYCWEDGKDKAKEKLVGKIDDSIKKRMEALQKLSAAHEKGYKFVEMKQYDRD